MPAEGHGGYAASAGRLAGRGERPARGAGLRCRSCTPVPEEVRQAADLLGRRSMLAIVWASHAGAVRFNEFLQAVGAIPPRTLAARLTELEQAGVLERTVIDARPPRVEYRLTAKGRRLEALVDALQRWAAARV